MNFFLNRLVPSSFAINFNGSNHQGHKDMFQSMGRAVKMNIFVKSIRIVTVTLLLFTFTAGLSIATEDGIEILSFSSSESPVRALTSCPAGKYFYESNACLYCPPGQYQPSDGSDACIFCADGQSSITGGTACSSCSKGKYSDGTRGQCLEIIVSLNNWPNDSGAQLCIGNYAIGPSTPGISMDPASADDDCDGYSFNSDSSGALCFYEEDVITAAVCAGAESLVTTGTSTCQPHWSVSHWNSQLETVRQSISSSSSPQYFTARTCQTITVLMTSSRITGWTLSPESNSDWQYSLTLSDTSSNYGSDNVYLRQGSQGNASVCLSPGVIYQVLSSCESDIYSDFSGTFAFQIPGMTPTTNSFSIDDCAYQFDTGVRFTIPFSISEMTCYDCAPGTNSLRGQGFCTACYNAAVCPSGKCLKPYKGLICSNCRKGYFKFNGFCKECPNSYSLYVGILISLLILGFLYYLSDLLTVVNDSSTEIKKAVSTETTDKKTNNHVGTTNGKKSNDKSKNWELIAVLNYTVHHFQVVGICITFDPTMPNLAANIFSWINIVLGLNFSQQSSPECTTKKSMSYSAQWAIATTVPVFILVCSAVVVALAPKSWERFKAQKITFATLIFNFSFIFVTALSMQIWYCVPLDKSSNVKVLFVASDIQCTFNPKSSYAYLLSFSVIYFILYVGGRLVLGCVLKGKDGFESVTMQMSQDFKRAADTSDRSKISTGKEKDFSYWAEIKNAHKLYVVIASALLVNQKQIQVISIMIITAVLAIATFYFKPHMESKNKGLSSNTADGFLLLNAATMNAIVAYGAFTDITQRFGGPIIMNSLYLLNFFAAVFVCVFQVIRKSQGEKEDTDFDEIYWTYCKTCCCRFFSNRKAFKSPEDL